MMQGNWTPMLAIPNHSVPAGILGQDGVGKYVSRPLDDIFKFILLGGHSSNTHVEIEVSEDGTKAIVRQSRTFGLACGMEASNDRFGTVKLSREMTVSLEGEPRVIDAKVSQKLNSSLREIE